MHLRKAMAMVISIILAFFAGGAVIFFAVAACAISKQADNHEQDFPFIGGSG
jgi:hypothetical protein